MIENITMGVFHSNLKYMNMQYLILVNWVVWSVTILVWVYLVQKYMEPVEYEEIPNLSRYNLPRVE